MKINKYLNSVEAANILGVNVSTIKRWTDSGRLKCVKTAGGHRKFLMKHLNEYLKSQSSDTKDITVTPYDTSEHRQLNHLIQKHSTSDLKELLLKYSLDSKNEEVGMIITGLALGQYPLYKIFDDVITPALHKIGKLWENGDISVVEEHIASNIIRDSVITLREIIVNVEKSDKVFCLAFDDDQHDIPLKMVQIILEQRGYNVYYTGQRTPSDSLEKLISKVNPSRLYLSGTYYDESWNEKQLESKQQELSTLYDLSEIYKFDLYIGGQVFDKLPFNENKIKRRLYTFKDVYKY